MQSKQQSGARGVHGLRGPSTWERRQGGFPEHVLPAACQDKAFTRSWKGSRSWGWGWGLPGEGQVLEGQGAMALSNRQAPGREKWETRQQGLQG